MNASQLYKDEFYAYYEDPPRGRTPLGAAKVRLRGQESRKSSWETNRRTYAMVTVVEPGNGTSGYGKHKYCKPGQELLVPARHLIDFWSDYEAEANLLLQEHEARKLETRRRALREQVLISMITWKIQHMGMHMPLPAIRMEFDGSGYIQIPLGEVIAWLEIDSDEVERKVEELLEV